MKRIHYIVLSAGMLAIVACGPSKEEKEAAEKARQDSIAAAQKMIDDSIAAAAKWQADSLAAEIDRMRQDSIAMADSIANAKKRPPARPKKKEEPKEDSNSAIDKMKKDPGTKTDDPNSAIEKMKKK